MRLNLMLSFLLFSLSLLYLISGWKSVPTLLFVILAGNSVLGEYQLQQLLSKRVQG